MSAILYGLKHKRFPSTDIDIALHGSEAGARAHWRRGETPCRACRLAHNRVKRQRQARNRLNGLPPDDPRHGVYGYRSFNCRCDICLEQGRAAQRRGSAR